MEAGSRLCISFVIPGDPPSFPEGETLVATLWRLDFTAPELDSCAFPIQTDS
jgi:hypothetical protein